MTVQRAQYVDSHAHLDAEQFDEDREAVVERALAAGVTRIITVGADLASSRAAVRLAERHISVFATVGVHPHFASGCDKSTIDELRRFAGHERVVGIGEIGLDYYRDRSPRDKQRDVFVAQLELAAELDLPVVVHDRDAHDDVLRLLREAALRGAEVDRISGVMHCFSGDVSLAAGVLALGMYVSFAGPITYQRPDLLRPVVCAIPSERLLVETDCPYLSPQPVRGGRNEPAYVVYIYERLADLRSDPLDVLARQGTENACALFGLPSD